MPEILIKDWKAKPKGKGRGGIEWSMEVDVPGLQGTLSARKLGTILAAEMVDVMRNHMHQGKRAGGAPALIRYNENMQNGRAIKRALIEGAPMTGKFRELTAWVSRALKDDGGSAPEFKTKKGRTQWIARRAKLIQHYTGAHRFGTIDGVRKPPQIQRYLPDPDNQTAVNDSGMMADFLGARYVPQRSSVNRATGQRHDIKSQIIFSTTKSRQSAAFKYGGLGSISPQQFVERNRANMTYTFQAWDNAVMWKEKSTENMILITTLRIVGHLLRRIGSI